MNQTVKIQQASTPPKIAAIFLKFEVVLPYINVPKRQNGSVDPDQTAPWTRSTLFAQSFLSEYLGLLQ